MRRSEKRAKNKHSLITKLLPLASFPYHVLGMRLESSYNYADLESSLKLFKRDLSVMVGVKRRHYMVQSRVTTITELCYFLASDVTFALWVK